MTLTGAPHHGPTVYTTDVPIRFEKPFSLAGPRIWFSARTTVPTSTRWTFKTVTRLRSHRCRRNGVTYPPASASTALGCSRESPETTRLFLSWSVCTNWISRHQQIPRGRDVLQRKLQLIADARFLINDYHPKSSADQLTDQQRYYIGNAHQRVLLTDTYTDIWIRGLRNSDSQWKSGPYFWDRFGIRFACKGETSMVAVAMEEGHQQFNESFFKSVPTGISLGLYHLVVQLSGAGQIWAALVGINEDGQPVDMTDRVFAGVGFVSSAIFAVAGSKYLSELSPEASASRLGGRVRGEEPSARSAVERETGAREVVDEPTDAAYALNPDTAERVRVTLEGTRIVGEVRELDVNLARHAYGPNALFRSLASGEPGILQITNKNCLIDVARVIS